MKIQLKNFQRHRKLEADAPEGQVTFIHGFNESGKTSVADAIWFAITGKSGRVAKVSDFGSLVTDGAKSGSVTLHFGEGFSISRNIRDRKGHGEPPWPADHPLVPILLGQHSLMDMKPAERRRLLIQVVGVDMSASRIRKELTERGVSEEIINAIGPYLQGGFDNALEQAKAEKSACRGRWEQVTGERFGEKKAEKYADEDPPYAPCEEIPDIEDAVRQAQSALSQAIGRQEMHDEMIESKKAEQERLDKNRKLAEKVDEYASEVDDINEAVQNAEEAVSELRAELDRAAISADVLECPSCEVSLRVENRTLVEADTPPDIDTESLTEQLSEAQDDLRKIKKDQAEAQSNLAAAQHAAKAVKEAEESETGTVERPSDEEIQELREEAEKQQAGLDQAREDLRVNERHRSAKQAYEAWCEWDKAETALAPDGIPAELLAESLEPVNNAMHEIRDAAGYSEMYMIDHDMQFTRDLRPYHLLSKSAQWRANTILTLALASLTDIALVALDEFDILEPGHRAKMMKAMGQWAEENEAALIVLGTAIREAEPKDPRINPLWLDS